MVALYPERTGMHDDAGPCASTREDRLELVHRFDELLAEDGYLRDKPGGWLAKDDYLHDMPAGAGGWQLLEVDQGRSRPGSAMSMSSLSEDGTVHNIVHFSSLPAVASPTVLAPFARGEAPKTPPSPAQTAGGVPCRGAAREAEAEDARLRRGKSLGLRIVSRQLPLAACPRW